MNALVCPIETFSVTGQPANIFLNDLSKLSHEANEKSSSAVLNAYNTSTCLTSTDLANVTVPCTE